jgi:hypothetical protein
MVYLDFLKIEKYFRLWKINYNEYLDEDNYLFYLFLI